MKLEIQDIGVESFTTAPTAAVDPRPTLQCETVGCLPETVEECSPYTDACTVPPVCIGA